MLPQEQWYGDGPHKLITHFGVMQQVYNESFDLIILLSSLFFGQSLLLFTNLGKVSYVLKLGTLLN